MYCSTKAAVTENQTDMTIFTNMITGASVYNAKAARGMKIAAVFVILVRVAS